MKLACFISWIFSFGIVVIIPLDIYYVKNFNYISEMDFNFLILQSYHLKHEYEDGEIENAPEF